MPNIYIYIDLAHIFVRFLFQLNCLCLLSTLEGNCSRSCQFHCTNKIEKESDFIPRLILL